MFDQFFKFLWQEHRSYLVAFVSIVLNLGLMTALIFSGDEGTVQTLQQENLLLTQQLETSQVIAVERKALLDKQASIITAMQSQNQKYQLALADAEKQLKLQKTQLVEYKQTSESCSPTYTAPSDNPETRLAANQKYEEYLYETVFNEPYPSHDGGMHH